MEENESCDSMKYCIWYSISVQLLISKLDTFLWRADYPKLTADEEKTTTVGFRLGVSTKRA